MLRLLALASAVALAACSSIDNYKGPLAIPNTPSLAPTLELGAGAFGEYQRDLHWCIAEVQLIPQHWDAKGIAINVATGAVQGFMLGVPAYAATKNLLPAEITGATQATTNLGTSVTSNLEFFSSQKIGFVNACMRERRDHPDAAYLFLD